MKKMRIGLAFIMVLVLAANMQLSVYAQPAPTISAHSAILINADTGTILFEKNAYEERAMASLTKIMSTLLTIEAGDLDVPFEVDPYAIRVEGTSMGLRPGDIVTRRALCYGMMLPSGNDASNAAAVSVSGNIPQFVELMNQKATQLKMYHTRFANPSGLDAYGHYSTAFDMARLTVEALKNPLFSEICRSSSAQVEFGNPPYPRWLNNNNKLLYMYEGTIGVKTGFTDDARRCLVSAVERDGVTLIAVTLNAPDDWNDHMKMYDYGFALYGKKVINYDLSGYGVHIVSGDKEFVGVRYSEVPYVNLLEEEMAMVTIKVNPLPFLYGGFDIGEFAGNVTYYYNDVPIKSTPLVTAENSVSKKEPLTFAGKVERFLRILFG